MKHRAAPTRAVWRGMAAVRPHAHAGGRSQGDKPAYLEKSHTQRKTH
ncbi:hypothetical protein FHS14_001767 [Paenibacillus baekrokdamisoli]|nr:hypothetical protein [Paenibacillus baekrokdamisoli]